MVQTQYVITGFQNGLLGCYFENGKIEDVIYEPNQRERIGNIYVAKVSQVASNINAVFLYYAKGKRGYLPFDQIKNPILLNRKYDGRILSGDELLVQLTSESIRTKDPGFTTDLSIAGKYCVISTGDTSKGVSSKIDKPAKEQLKALVSQQSDFGIVIRTCAKECVERGDCSPVLLEIQELSNTMKKLIEEGIHRVCYSLLYQSSSEFITFLRNHCDGIEKIVTDQKEIYDLLSVQDYKDKVSFYDQDNISLANLYRIPAQMEELTASKVWLKSGAYLVIEQTEAMYVIDVNSGKNNIKKDNQTYIYQINEEAAKEILRQIRLRNLSGMILVDFINLDSKDMQNKLFSFISREARKDPVKTQIIDYTKLGLLEITRKKTKKSLKSQLKA